MLQSAKNSAFIMTNIHPNPPKALLPFLTTKHSLTQLLEDVAGTPLKVVVVTERFRPLNFLEKQRLHLPTLKQTLAWERQVLLFGNTDKPWVQAASLFPLPTLQGQSKRLKHLKNTPIGYVLFKKNKQLPFDRYWQFADGQFGRQTIYEWQNKHLLIQETFLSEFEKILQQK